MQIQSTLRLTKINHQNTAQMQKLVAGKEQIAWPEEIDKEVAFDGHKRVYTLSNTPNFRTFSIDEKHSAETNRQLRKEYLSLTKTGCKLAKQCFPGQLDKPIKGIKFLIASVEAYDAWTDKNESYVIDGSLATGKAFMKAYELLAPYFTVLQQYSTHQQVAGLVLNIADHVYVLQKEIDNREFYRAV